MSCIVKQWNYVALRMGNTEWVAFSEGEGSLKKKHLPFQKSWPGERLLNYSLTFGSSQVDW